MYPYAVHGGLDWLKFEVFGMTAAISSNLWREELKREVRDTGIELSRSLEAFAVISASTSTKGTVRSRIWRLWQ